jgi:uncharacterized protein (DUF2235 family)
MKRLVVCCDGTWNRRDAGPNASNVAKLAEGVAAMAGKVRQRVFYDAGVGTGGFLDRIVGGATGRGLEKNVLDAYRFLVANHRAGDELFVFGFSRGAYTARSVVGMVRKCGILRNTDEEGLREAYRLYRSGEHPDSEAACAFRAKHSKETRVRFIGVWDTVGALGIPAGPFRSFNLRRHGFHDVQLSRIVDVACHALAIDERRGAFKPTLWTTTPDPRQVVKQEWFPGAHSNVGGGYPQAGLSDVALAWMMDEASAAGLAFTAGARQRVRPDPLARLVDSRGGLWRLLPGGWRAIGEPTHQPQAIHGSALQRKEAPASTYRPPNLLAYLAGAGSTSRRGQAASPTPAVAPRRRRNARPGKARAG